MYVYNKTLDKVIIRRNANECTNECTLTTHRQSLNSYFIKSVFRNS